MNFIEDTIISLFCIIDDFCLDFEPEWHKRLIDNRKRKREYSLTLSEIMSIVINFHNSGYRTFKKYYQIQVRGYLKRFFPKLVSYNRFVELIKSCTFPLFCFLQGLMGNSTGISIVDSTPLPVCHNRRINSHKVFKEIAKRGKISTGWFYGLKLHLVINDQGEIMAWMITSGNVDDRKPVPTMCEGLSGLLFGDRGYTSGKLFKELYEHGLKLVTKIKSNMKNVLIDVFEKFLLKKRGIVECVIQYLKETSQIQHTRHRSTMNFVVNLMSGLAAYCIFSEKPSMGLNERERLLIFSEMQ